MFNNRLIGGWLGHDLSVAKRSLSKRNVTIVANCRPKELNMPDFLSHNNATLGQVHKQLLLIAAVLAHASADF